ncbi:MAG: Stp1/IreP family PP2C-type Ser/Thr phosphatase [Myxococcota bacterium]
MCIVSTGMTDVGLKRGHNEDNYLINEELNLFVVADGMGGHAGGEYASAIAVNTVEEVVTSLELEGMAGEGADADPIEITRHKLSHAIRLAGRRIFDKARQQPSYHGMGTTAVVLLVQSPNAFVAHVGDSRLYLVRDGEVRQITEDHSLIAEKVKHGLITPEEAKNHRMRNVITRSLGYQEEVDVDLQVLEVASGDQFLLCSDGLSGFVSAEEIGEVLASHGTQEAARQLVMMACDRGGDDNITAIIARVEASA